MKRLFLVAILGWGCSEAPLIVPKNATNFNNPVSMGLIPSTNLAVVANANVNLDQESGTLVAVDLDQQSVLANTAIAIPNFSGRMAVDASRSRIYLPDREHNALLVYRYTVPGEDGQAISFAPQEVTNPAKNTVNGVDTDENPMMALMVKTASLGDLLLVTNDISGSLSMIRVDGLESLDLDPQDKNLFGLPLLSASNFQMKDQKPGKGAGRMARAPNDLFYITSTRSNYIYVVDLSDQNVEGMLDLTGLSVSGGCRGIAIDSKSRAYVAHQGLNAILVLDVSLITDNGMNAEVIQPRVIEVIRGGGQPEAVALSPDEKYLLVTNIEDGTLEWIDTETFRVDRRKVIPGVSPSEIVIDEGRGRIYILHFLSDSIAVVELATGDTLGLIE